MRGAGRRGFTLIELLLVLGVVSLLVGFGLGVFASLDFGRRQALGIVKNTLRAAQNTALARGAPTRVDLDLGAGTLTPRARFTVGTWQFESATLEGAFGHSGTMVGGRLVDDGFLGRALDLSGAGREARAVFPVQDAAAWDLAEGFALECALRLEADAPARVLDVGRSCGLDVLPGGALRGWIVPELRGVDGEPVRGAPVLAESPPGSLPLGRWTRVAVDYDRAALRVLVEGLEVARREERAPVAPLAGPLTVSAEDSRLPGAVDALVVHAVVAGELAVLPEGVGFGADTPASVRFEAGGGLMRGTGPVRLTLRFDDGAEETVQVGVYGTVEG